MGRGIGSRTWTLMVEELLYAGYMTAELVQALMRDQPGRQITNYCHYRLVKHKRQRSSRPIAQNKRVRSLATSPADAASPPVSLFQDIWDLPSSLDYEAIFAPSQDLGNTPRPRSPPRHRTETPAPIRRGSQHDSSSGRTPASAPVIDLTHQVNDEEELSDAESISTASSSSKSGLEDVRQNVKRIRGVLPASWLRLDLQKGVGVKRKQERSRHNSPDRDPTVPKRGVAVPKNSTSTSTPKTPAAPFFVSDESDDDNDATNTLPIEKQRRRSLSPEAFPIAIWSDDDDGAGSVVEEDHIDRMYTGPSRKRTSHGETSASKRRKTTHKNDSNGPSGRTYQPKITQALGHASSKTSSTKRLPSTAKPKGTGTNKQPRAKRRKRQAKRAATPPMLSILDVLEPRAPSFLKIAARTAKRKKNLGKSSPSHKHIDFGTRGDNVDARSVLQDWKSGRIRPKVAISRNKQRDKRPPLQGLSANHVSSPLLSRTTDLQPGRAASDCGEHPQKAPPRTKKTSSIARGGVQSWTSRPAQLETEENDPQDRAAFVARKRILDALYRKTRKDTSNTSVRLDQLWNPVPPSPSIDGRRSNVAVDEVPPARTTSRRNNVKSRFRKRIAPRRVDLEALHFVHANDPILVDDFSIPDVDEPREENDKLGGLGPYGTKYTHHFEIFPLDRGVFFHSTSIVGSGWLTKIMDPSYPESTHQVRPRALFTLDGKALKWGAWDDTTSSELGILVDWIAEQIQSRETSGEGPLQAKPRDAAAFLLGYVVDSVSFGGEDAEKSFMSRCIEVLGGFVTRVDEFTKTATNPKKNVELRLQVLTFFPLVLAAVHRLSSSVRSLKFQVEDLFVKGAKLCIKGLLSYGLQDLRMLYGDLQHLSARERGIRSDQTVADSWAVLIKVLENARIPRASFWDVSQAVMLESWDESGSDARRFEKMWQDMFTLLPLTEMDDYGVVKPGMRHAAPVEGWAVPQRLLKRVFQLYSANAQQPASFNEYCRTLAARCHYLVQQWGWRKRSGTVGTWFDFFGSHNLSHLRNEVVHTSPKFLDELSGNPSLNIDPEDRCFHIFLKMLGMVIQRLKKLGLTNDIKNLVARTLPNHNREYRKEDAVHERDLAALRNHHDLLCTLFWAAPPDLRPAVSLIEKLVAPASSHKEALLINLRAWSQLARFVVSSDEGHDAFKPIMFWQNNIFQQLMHQYRTAAKDIKDQVDAMTGPPVEKEVIESMVRTNRSVAMGMLFVSAKVSFEVLKLAGSLNTATYVFNTKQLQQIFSLDFVSQGLDWSVVSLAIDMVDHYLSRVEKAAEEQYSSEATDPQELQDAVEMLDHFLADKFFKMGRELLGLPTSARGFPREQARCIERTVTLSARMACRFMDAGMTPRMAVYFASEKYGLFPEFPVNLASPYRKYLPLFIATLVKNNYSDIKEAKTSLLHLWMVSIVKPAHALGYENTLAETLKHRRRFGLERVALLPGTKPDYSSNLHMFTCGVQHMRDEIRKAADSVSSRQLRKEYHAILHSVMQKMKDDLESKTWEPAEHKHYMYFVREIITVIKTHGVNICPVDTFFTQLSVHYSPPPVDPQLHAAGIMSYGIRLAEGEKSLVPQLFHYLYTHFKNSLLHNKLDEECHILENAMENAHILSFILTQALPAILWATSKDHEAWPLLDVYVAALRNFLTRSPLSREVGENDMGHVAKLLDYILMWFRTRRNTDQQQFLEEVQLRIVTQLVDLANSLRPSLITHMCSGPKTEDAEIQRRFSAFKHFATAAADYIDCTTQPRSKIHISSLFQGVPDFEYGPVFQSGRELPPQTDSFASVIVKDVRELWLVTPTSVSINTPAGREMSSTQAGPGTRYEGKSILTLGDELRGLLESWIPVDERRRRRRVMDMANDLVI